MSVGARDGAASASFVAAVRSRRLSSKVRPLIDRAYPLGETGGALAHWRRGHTRGKAVIIV